jgi:hypothetical protein
MKKLFFSLLPPPPLLHLPSSSYLTLAQHLETSMPIKLNMCERTISQLPVVISKEVLQTKEYLKLVHLFVSFRFYFVSHFIGTQLSFTWLDLFDRNTSNCFITDSNDQLTADTLAFSSYKTNQKPLCDVLSVWILPSGRRYDFWKKQKNKCQINMSKANLNNSIIGMFMKTCLDAYRVFYGKSSNYWSL